MKRKSKFTSYCKEHIKTIIAAILVVIIFLVVFWLHGVPLEVPLYAGILSIVLVAIFVGWDFSKYCKRHREIVLALEHIETGMWEMPEGGSLQEEAYKDIIKELLKIKQTLEADTVKADRELRDYFTLWVHQIKTPIFALQLLLKDEENKQVTEEVLKIEQYVQMALSYVRMGSMTSDLKFEKYSLDEMVKDIIKKYSPIFIAKKIPLEYKELNCSFVTDRKWLTLVIEQIISNSLKYIGSGGLKIYMAADKILVIEDTGIGISKEDLPRIFEKGFTGYNGRAHEKSTGMGLYMCKTIMEKMGYDIRIESWIGHGTKVYLDFRNPEKM